MRFLEGLFGVVKNGCEDVKPLFRAVIVGSGSVYLENVLSVKSYSSDKIEVKVKGGNVTVKGNGLTIKKYCEGDLAICGTVVSLERV